MKGSDARGSADHSVLLSVHQSGDDWASGFDAGVVTLERAVRASRYRTFGRRALEFCSTNASCPSVWWQAGILQPPLPLRAEDRPEECPA